MATGLAVLRTRTCPSLGKLGRLGWSKCGAYMAAGRPAGRRRRAAFAAGPVARRGAGGGGPEQDLVPAADTPCVMAARQAEDPGRVRADVADARPSEHLHAVRIEDFRREE